MFSNFTLNKDPLLSRIGVVLESGVYGLFTVLQEGSAVSWPREQGVYFNLSWHVMVLRKLILDFNFFANASKRAIKIAVLIKSLYK